jgi:hypothetical protein
VLSVKDQITVAEFISLWVSVLCSIPSLARRTDGVRYDNRFLIGIFEGWD